MQILFSTTQVILLVEQKVQYWSLLTDTHSSICFSYCLLVFGKSQSEFRYFVALDFIKGGQNDGG